MHWRKTRGSLKVGQFTARAVGASIALASLVLIAAHVRMYTGRLLHRAKVDHMAAFPWFAPIEQPSGAFLRSR
jgi:hypothetical protein